MNVIKILTSPKDFNAFISYRNYFNVKDGEMFYDPSYIPRMDHYYHDFSVLFFFSWSRLLRNSSLIITFVTYWNLLCYYYYFTM